MSVKRYVNNMLTTFHSYTEGDDYGSIRASVGESWYRAEDYDALRAQLEKLEFERHDNDAHIAECQTKLANAGIQCGATGNIVLGIERLLEREKDAYQRGAREMRERAVKECDVIAAEDMARRYRPSLPSYCRDRIRALPDTLPTGPSG